MTGKIVWPQSEKYSIIQITHQPYYSLAKIFARESVLSMRDAVMRDIFFTTISMSSGQMSDQQLYAGLRASDNGASVMKPSQKNIYLNNNNTPNDYYYFIWNRRAQKRNFFFIYFLRS